MEQVLKNKLNQLIDRQLTVRTRHASDKPVSSQIDDGQVAGGIERETVKRAQQGDKEAFRELVERYQNRAFRLALTVLKDKAEAEDVTQEAFVKAFLSLADFENKSSFFTWLYRIVMNMAIDFRRRRKRRGVEVSLDEPPQSADANEEKRFSNVIADKKPDPEAQFAGAQAMALLQRSFDQLSEQHRAVVMLREVDGLSYDEIAEALGLAKGTVMSRLFYARKKLQDDVNKE